VRARLLLHTCCAPCGIFVGEFFEKEGLEVVHLFYNPNIHPFAEYKRRWETLADYAFQSGRVVLAPFPYNPLEYFTAVWEGKERCVSCYRLRLLQVARWGKAHGFSLYSTTLTISPYQDVAAIERVGKEVEEEVGITFLGKDLRSGFPESMRRARELGLYRQNYCGCIFSKWEGVKKRLWKSLTGPGSS
jgi:predicted adenine nucleotide alpha hydrolase (AANH) superfamily ATPase